MCPSLREINQVHRYIYMDNYAHLPRYENKIKFDTSMLSGQGRRVKLPPFATRRHVEVVEVQLNSLLPSARVRGKRSTSRPRCFTAE
jgi:hypothetical protein